MNHYEPDTDAPDTSKLTEQQLRQRIAELEEELTVTDKLLATRQEVLNEIPECPTHGNECMPHALDWIKRAKELEVENRKLANRVDDLEHDFGMLAFCGTAIDKRGTILDVVLQCCMGRKPRSRIGHLYYLPQG